MKLGDFFENAASCRAVNPKPVQFKATFEGKVFPNGQRNPSKGRVKVDMSGAFALVDGDATAEARVDARRALLKRCLGAAEETPVQPSQADYDLELMYHVLWRAIREYEPETGAGDPLFPTVDVTRKMLVPREANRLFDAYLAYVAEEHPEVPDQGTFRKTEG